MAAPTTQTSRSTTAEYQMLVAAYTYAARSYAGASPAMRPLLAREAARAAAALQGYVRHAERSPLYGGAWADIARRWEARRG